MGKFKRQTERYCRENLGATTLNSLPKKYHFLWKDIIGGEVRFFAVQTARIGCATGAMMSPDSIKQGGNIIAVAHLLEMRSPNSDETEEINHG